MREPHSTRRGGALLEAVIFVPVILALLIGTVSLGRVIYTYYTLEKLMFGVARYVGTQQGVNFCNSGDPTVEAAIDNTLLDSAGNPIVPGLTAEMFQIQIERYDPVAQALSVCDCSAAGCDASQGGRPPDFLGVSLTDGVFRSNRSFGDSRPSRFRSARVSWCRMEEPDRLRRFLRPRCRRGQLTTVEFALVYAGVLVPLTFGLIYVSQLLWVWHSVVDFTRQGASYAATHCWESSAANVIGFMRSNVPLMVDRNQFQTGPAVIGVTYYAIDPATGTLSPFGCATDCSTACIPDEVTVTVTGYQFSDFVSYLGLPPVPLPNFQASQPVESAGCDPEQGTCLP